MPQGTRVQDNRYAPTQAALNSQSTVEHGEQQIEPASRGRRFANLLIDTVASVIISMVVGVLLAIVWPQFLIATADFQGSPESLILFNYLFGAIVGFIYYVPMEALTGRTLGKLITGTRVVSGSGEPPTFPQVLGRTLARYIPFEAFTFLSSTRVGLHDKLANTRVVSTRRAASA
ncbi:MAG TPA: RDD family protein [Steroidobacteraceae bacterium]|jgi:uncharacterized RDD family membrane protein YckC